MSPSRLEPFNPKRARAKRPCPLWVDAFQRDTQHLEADEVGAYILILMAMWTRESCDFPADPYRLARVSRVSLRLWKSRIGPVLMPFFQTDEATIWSKRLRQEATYTERQVTHQSARKAGEKSDNPLDYMEADQSADTSADGSAAPSYPTTQLPNNIRGGAAESREAPTFRERILVAMGQPIDSRKIGSPTDMLEAGRWITDLGLTEDEVVGVVEAASAASIARSDPPSAFRYFTKAMQRHAAAKAEGALQPAAIAPRETPTITISAGGQNGPGADRARFDAAHREYTRRLARGEINRGPDPSDPFAR